MKDIITAEILENLAARASKILEDCVFGKVIAGEEEQVVSQAINALRKIANAPAATEAVVQAKWIMDEEPHDGDVRCSACRSCVDAMHERNHAVLNALTGGKWWTFYRYCPYCGAIMNGATSDAP